MPNAIFGRVSVPLRRVAVSAALAAGGLALPAAAQAHHDPFLDGAVVVDAPPVVVDPAGPVWVEAVYRTVVDRQWVAPVVQTVTARVWVPPTTAAAAQRVFVPDQFGWRTVLAYDGWGRPYRSRQWVLVRPAHYEDQLQPVVVTAGHYEDVPQQQVVAEGHWADVERQELVAPGHWEPAVAVPVGPPPRHRFHLHLPF